MTWPVVPLGEVAHTALGKMLDRGKSRGHDEVPYLRNVNVQWGRIDTGDLLTMELADDERDRFGVEPGDLLVCEGGEIGRAAIWHGGAEYLAYQKALHRVRPHGNLDARYLRYLFEHHAATGTLARLSTGSTIAHLPQQRLRLVPVPLAPLADQLCIADLLEEHLSRLDAAEKFLGAAERRLGALRLSALDRQFGLASATDSVALADLLTGVSAGRSFGATSAPAGEDEWGIIRVSAMTYGEFRAEENKAVPAEKADPRYEIREGDLLVSRANTSQYVGSSVLVGSVRPRLLLSDKSLRLTARDDVRADWLWRALQAPSARRQISDLATGTKDSMRNIAQAALLQVRLPAADRQTQESALAAYGTRADAHGRLEAELATQGARQKRLRRALLSAAFTGQLTGHASDLERAEKLAGASVG